MMRKKSRRFDIGNTQGSGYVSAGLSEDKTTDLKAILKVQAAMPEGTGKEKRKKPKKEKKTEERKEAKNSRNPPKVRSKGEKPKEAG